MGWRKKFLGGNEKMGNVQKKGHQKILENIY